MSTSPKTLTASECEILLDYIKNKSHFHSDPIKRSRNHLITLIMLDAGLRVGEAVQLRVEDLLVNDEATPVLVLQARITKTKQERILPLTNRLKEAIESHYNMSPIWRAYDIYTYAFVGNSSKWHITVRAVQLSLHACSLASIGRAVTPHQLRHTFATRLMQTTNIRIVQKLLGHTSIASTQVYTHPNQDDLTNAIKSLE